MLLGYVLLPNDQELEEGHISVKDILLPLLQVEPHRFLPVHYGIENQLLT